MELNNKELNRRIDSRAARITGKPTLKKIMAMFPLEEAPDPEYVKAYLKKWYS
jgi:hypothetical protein